MEVALVNDQHTHQSKPQWVEAMAACFITVVNTPLPQGRYAVAVHTQKRCVHTHAHACTHIHTHSALSHTALSHTALSLTQLSLSHSSLSHTALSHTAL